MVNWTKIDLFFYLKVTKDKLALISRLWKCKEGERLTLNSFTKMDRLDGFRLL